MSNKVDQTNHSHGFADNFAKLYAQEATKEIIKAKIAGKIFKMADFDKIRANPKQYEPEIARWKNAINKTFADKKDNSNASSIAKKHMYLWGHEDEKAEVQYADLPVNGVPKDKTEIVALMKNGRLGPKYKRKPLQTTDLDAVFDPVVQQISGGMYNTLDEYITDHDKIAEAVELARLTLAAALNAEMEGPFIKGQWKDFKSVMAWVDIQTEIEEKTEYMHELFEKMDRAFEGDSHVDAKCMEYRMALESLYIDKAMKFPDWEYGDDFAETFEADGYTPTLSFIFLWEIYKQMGKEAWCEVEEEFRREIGTEKYNKDGWMQNKAKLYKLINKKHKKPSKAKVASLEPTTDNDIDSDNDDITFEMDDGTILKIQPKFRGPNGSWRQNFTRQFNLQQGPNNRWQARRNQNNQRNNQGRNQNNQNGNSNSSLNNKNFNNNNNNRRNNNKSDKPSPDQTWKCRRCENEGRTRIMRGDQQCPRHKWRPTYFDSIPIAAIKTIENDDKSEFEQQKASALASLASIRMALYDDDELTDHSF